MQVWLANAVEKRLALKVHTNMRLALHKEMQYDDRPFVKEEIVGGKDKCRMQFIGANANRSAPCLLALRLRVGKARDSLEAKKIRLAALLLL